MDTIGDRILLKRSDSEITAIIRAAGKKDKRKILLLKSWVIAWSIAGLAMLSVFFINTTQELRIYALIFMVFWAYYLYMTAYAYYFRRYGNEVVYIQNKKLMIRRDVKEKKGRPRFYEIKEQSPFRLIADKAGGIKATAGKSFWNIYSGTIGFGKKNKPYRFGLQLSEKDALLLIKVLNKYADIRTKKR